MGQPHGGCAAVFGAARCAQRRKTANAHFELLAVEFPRGFEARGGSTRYGGEDDLPMNICWAVVVVNPPRTAGRRFPPNPVRDNIRPSRGKEVIAARRGAAPRSQTLRGLVGRRERRALGLLRGGAAFRTHAVAFSSRPRAHVQRRIPPGHLPTGTPPQFHDPGEHPRLKDSVSVLPVLTPVPEGQETGLCQSPVSSGPNFWPYQYLPRGAKPSFPGCQRRLG